MPGQDSPQGLGPYPGLSRGWVGLMAVLLLSTFQVAASNNPSSNSSQCGEDNPSSNSTNCCYCWWEEDPPLNGTDPTCKATCPRATFLLSVDPKWDTGCSKDSCLMNCTIIDPPYTCIPCHASCDDCTSSKACSKVFKWPAVFGSFIGGMVLTLLIAVPVMMLIIKKKQKRQIPASIGPSKADIEQAEEGKTHYTPDPTCSNGAQKKTKAGRNSLSQSIIAFFEVIGRRGSPEEPEEVYENVEFNGSPDPDTEVGSQPGTAAGLTHGTAAISPLDYPEATDDDGIYGNQEMIDSQLQLSQAGHRKQSKGPRPATKKKKVPTATLR